MKTRTAVEIAGRVVLLGLAIHLLPRVFWGDVRHFYGQATHYSLLHLDRFPYRYTPHHQQTYEFPPLTLAFLDLERLSFHSEAVYIWLFGLTMAAFEYGSLLLLRAAWPEHRRRLDVIWYASVVPMALLGWFRFDFAAIFFATVAVIALAKGTTRGGVAGVLLGFGTKLWPGALIPCFVVKRRWREAALALGGCSALMAGWYAFSPSGFRRFLSYRAGTGLEIESLPGALRMLAPHPRVLVRSGAWVVDAGRLAWIDEALTVVLAVFVVGVIVWAWRHRDADVVAMGGALVLASFLFSRIISAQYVLWTAPFVAILWARGNRRVGWLNIGSTACTVGYLLFFKRGLVAGNRLVAGVVVVRNVLLVLLLVELTRAIHPRVRRPAPSMELTEAA